MSRAAVLAAYFTANTSKFEQGTRRAGDSLRQFDKKIGQSKAVMRRYQAAIFSVASAYGALSAGRNLVNTALQLEALNAKMITAVGATGDVRGELERLRKEANELGVDFQVSANNFASFAAAGRAAGIEMETIRDVFTQTSRAGVALQLSNEQMEGTFTALTQIAAKGVVSMEELRQQLGERVPIALSAMAEGLGITVQELDDLVSSGNLAADVGLKALADGFRNNADLALAFAKASDSTQAQVNRLNNKVFELKENLIKNTDIIPVFNSALDDLSDIISNPDFQAGLRILLETVLGIAKIASRAAEGIGIWARALGDLGDRMKRNKELGTQFNMGEISREELIAGVNAPTDAQIEREKKQLDKLEKEFLDSVEAFKNDIKNDPRVKDLQLVDLIGNDVEVAAPKKEKPTKKELKEQLKAEKEAAKQAEKAMQEYTRSIQDAQQIQRNYADEAGDTLFDLARGYESLRDVALRALDDILRSMFRLQMGGTSTGGIFGSIAEGLTGAIFGSPGANSITTASNGARVPVPLSKPSFATGIQNVPYDMTARLHKGEAVIPAQQAKKMGSGESVTYNIDARGAEAGVEQRIRGVLMEVQKLRDDVPKISVASVKDANNRNLGLLR